MTDDADSKLKSWIDLTNKASGSKDYGMSDALMINDREFIVLKESGVHNYNIKTNEWTKLIHFEPNRRSPSNFVCCADRNRKLIYCYHGWDKILLIINYQAKTYEEIQDCIEESVGHRAVITFINDQVHLIGGNDHSQHLIFNEEQKKFVTFCAWKRRYGMGLIHSSDQEIFIFGGSDGSIVDSVWSFNMKDKKWSPLDAKLPIKLTEFACVATNDKRYLIILGGIDGSYSYGHILYIIDMKANFKLIKKDKKMHPHQIFANTSTNNYSAIIMNDVTSNLMLTHGFIRRHFQQIEIFSDNLIDLIAKWCCLSELHILDKNNRFRNHLKMDLSLLFDF